MVHSFLVDVFLGDAENFWGEKKNGPNLPGGEFSRDLGSFNLTMWTMWSNCRGFCWALSAPKDANLSGDFSERYRKGIPSQNQKPWAVGFFPECNKYNKHNIIEG